MTSLDVSTDATRRPFSGRRVRLGDLILQGVAGLAALGSLVLVGLIAWKVIQGARLSISTFGFGFLTHDIWDPVHDKFGAASFLYGTAVTSFGALILATPIAIGIALFLTELAPPWIRGPVTALVETLAAIPSVVIGLWGILVLAPFLHRDVNPVLHSVLGFIPIFGPPGTYQENVFTAIVVLTMMILPIIASISRELFLSVPSELKEGALGLGTTRWEMIRGVSFPYARGGVAAAMILGLGRAIGEAIAVAQVIGAFTGISINFFNPGNTLGAQVALSYTGSQTPLGESSLFYLALILLVFSIVVNLVAQLIVRRSSRRLGIAR
ncbi:MAG TPA: phosphate ABC transporter permease subunit PstC [Gaiellaceae bacterium]|nr:phosphate ABC transporter permease subunit PstC [Gaiellaceae bacterium]